MLASLAFLAMVEEEMNSESSEDVEDVENVQLTIEDDNAKKTIPTKKEKRVKRTLNPKHVAKVKKKPGIVFLSYIPQYMNVTKVREIFSEYGTIGRLFLQPEKPKKNGKPSKRFIEGWVEFDKKSIAKQVASTLNGKQIGGKRKCPWYDSLWSIKYLHSFKWTHLNERLAYEKAVREQRMRTEISQAKKEANFYAHNAEQTRRRKKPKKTEDPSQIPKDATSTALATPEQHQRNPAKRTFKPSMEIQYKQKRTDEEMRQRKFKRNKINGASSETNSVSVLSSVFGSKE